jgi:Flp pilus assembly protein TadB
MPKSPTPPASPRSKLGDTVFAIVHVLALIAVFIYGVVALVQRNTGRFAVVMGGLVLYYFLVLHKAARKEIHRKRQLKDASPSKRS